MRYCFGILNFIIVFFLTHKHRFVLHFFVQRQQWMKPCPLSYVWKKTTDRKEVTSSSTSFRTNAVELLQGMQIQTNKSEDFVHVNFDAGIVVLTTIENLHFLRADGTFYKNPKHFSQHYTIYAFVNNLYIQLAFCFLSSKTVACYTQLWNFLVNLYIG